MLLENGRSRAATVEWVIDAAAADPSLVAGFDFAFSFPAWYCRARGWASGPEAWAAIAAEGETLLASCRPPFWGRPGVPRPHPREHGWRRTELEDAPGAKSVFQVGGSGAVGTGSLRGMAHLLTLRDAGFAVWPLHGDGLPAAVEIYPRAMYGPSVRKRRAAERAAFLREHHGDQDQTLLARAAASEDAFDAAVSALAMSAHAAQLGSLTPQPDDYALEGRVWVPDGTVNASRAASARARIAQPAR